VRREKESMQNDLDTIKTKKKGKGKEHRDVYTIIDKKKKEVEHKEEKI